MNNTKKSNRFFASVKEFGRKIIVNLKKNPGIIPFLMLIISFLVFSLNLTTISNTTANSQEEGMGLCQFAAMLFSILLMLCVLNAFPKRRKPNYPMVALFIILTAIIIYADIFYSIKVTEALAGLDPQDPSKLEGRLEYMKAYDTVITHSILMGITAVTVILEPVYAKLLKKINTSVVIEETSVDNIELADEE